MSIKSLTLNQINPGLIKAEYAVRGFIPTLASQISQELDKNPNKYPFKEVVLLNIGNPLSFPNNPMWSFRQVLQNYLRFSFQDNMQKFQRPDFSNEFERELIELSLKLQQEIKLQKINEYKGGYDIVRKSIVDFIQKRDKQECDVRNIYASDGGSQGIQLILQMLITSPNTGIMIPVPQYPLYSAKINLFMGKIVPYNLDEENKWDLSIGEIKDSYERAIKNNINVKAIVLINPGNPTGNVLSLEKMREIIEFANEKNLVILSDEVYQENVHTNKKWYSCKKVLREMDSHISNTTQLISFHSISKGILGECGLRAGYFELENPDIKTKKYINEWNTFVTPNISGQVMMTIKSKFLSGDLLKDVSKETYDKIKAEYLQIQNSLNRRAKQATQLLQSCRSMACNPIEGAMYCFPKILLHQKFIQEAKNNNLKPDVYYCKKLLEEEGICLVPGSGFGQKENTYHFRTTILPAPEDYLTNVFKKIIQFQDKITENYK